MQLSCYATKINSLMTEINLEQHFLDLGFEELVSESRRPPLGVNDMQVQEPYRPELRDLYRLHSIIRKKKRTTVLEFGVGWSTVVMADALRRNAKEYDISHLRRNNPFELHVVDDVEYWIEKTKERIDDEKVFFYHSPVFMREWNGRISTEYQTLPLVNPDFIYLDGPDQFCVRNDLCGISTRHKDMLPMACDILKLEWFLTPGSILVVDGRTANARFLKANFQREWIYECEEDQHIFTLVEDPLGKHSKNQLDFYSS